MKTIAWKNGEFVFRNERADSIVTELSRWYNVDVKFEMKLSKMRDSTSILTDLPDLRRLFIR